MMQLCQCVKKQVQPLLLEEGLPAPSMSHLELMTIISGLSGEALLNV